MNIAQAFAADSNEHNVFIPSLSYKSFFICFQLYSIFYTIHIYFIKLHILFNKVENNLKESHKKWERFGCVLIPLTCTEYLLSARKWTNQEENGTISSIKDFSLAMKTDIKYLTKMTMKWMLIMCSYSLNAYSMPSPLIGREVLPSGSFYCRVLSAGNLKRYESHKRKRWLLWEGDIFGNLSGANAFLTLRATGCLLNYRTSNVW